MSVAVAANVTGTSKFTLHPTTISLGQVITGFSVSFTVTVKLQLEWLPEGSVAVQFTVVVPFGKIDPDGGEQATVVARPEPSVAVTVKFTTAEHCPGSVEVTMSPGQVTTGGVMSVGEYWSYSAVAVA